MADMQKNNSFFHAVGDYLVWMNLLLGRILSVSPFRFLASIALSLAAQLAMVVSFFLPLKIVFLLGSEQVPSYLNGVVPISSVSELIVILMILSALSYFVFIGANRYAEALSSEGAQRLVEATSKLTLFQNQDELALRSYLRVGNFFAAVLFLAFSLTVFLVFYFNLFLIFLLCGAGLLGVLFVLFRVSPRSRASIEKTPGPFISQVYGVFFIVLFSVMVVDIVLWSDVGFYVSLICLLLVRQLLQRMTTATIDSVLLFRQIEQVNSIFLDADLQGAGHSNHKAAPLLDTLSDGLLLEFVRQVLSRLDRKLDDRDSDADFEVVYLQSSLVDVLSLLVKGEAGDVIIKVFHDRHKLLATRESDLMLSLADDDFFLSELKVIESVEGYRVHAFQLPTRLECRHDLTFKQRRDEFRVRCFSARPDIQFVERYRLSHSMLGRRVSDIARVLRFPMFKELFAEYSTANLVSLSQTILDELPITLCPSDITDDSLIVLEGGAVMNLHWERWAFEPMGFGLTLPELDLPHLRMLLDRSGLNDIQAEKVRLCGLLCIVEQQVKNQKLDKVKETVSLILHTVENLDGPERYR